MKYLKLFEAFDDIDTSVYSTATSEEDLTNYYKCTNCNFHSYIFNKPISSCKKCNSTSVVPSSDFDFFAHIKNNEDKGFFVDEMRKKKNRESNILNAAQLDLIEKDRLKN